MESKIDDIVGDYFGVTRLGLWTKPLKLEGGVARRFDETEAARGAGRQ